jgi:receptor expression-enhancing protein 5/6
MSLVNRIIEPLQLEALDRLPALRFVEEKYKLKPSLAAVALFAVLLLLAPLLGTYSLMTSLVCYLVPAYLSFLALESSDKQDDIRYLNYWIIFSLAEVFTPFLRFFLNNFLYMLLRMAVTALLLHPLSDLSLKCYNGLVRPFLRQHEAQIDGEIDRLAKEGKKKVLEEISESIKNLS